MSLVQHAQRELTAAGLLNKDSDYNGWIGESVLELMDVFAKQGHSGGSADYTRTVFHQLSQFKVLTPITDNPEEWMNVGAEMGGDEIWQSRRQSTLFSTDGGKTYYDLDEQLPLWKRMIPNQLWSWKSKLTIRKSEPFTPKA